MSKSKSKKRSQAKRSGRQPRKFSSRLEYLQWAYSTRSATHIMLRILLDEIQRIGLKVGYKNDERLDNETDFVVLMTGDRSFPNDPITGYMSQGGEA